MKANCKPLSAVGNKIPSSMGVGTIGGVLPGERVMPSRRLCVWWLTLLLTCGCASTRLVNTWKDPGFTAAPLNRILLIGVTKQAGIRRTFEDIFAQELRAYGVTPVQSYTLVPEDGEVPRETLQAAVEQSQADGVLITRLVRTDRQVQYYPGTYIGPPYLGFYGFYSSSWIGFYDPPQFYAYDVVTSETTLFGGKDNRLLWSGTSETFSPQDVRKDTQEFVTVIAKALAAQGLIPAKAR